MTVSTPRIDIEPRMEEQGEEQGRKFQLKAVLKDQKGGEVLSAGYCNVETDPVCDNLLAVVSEKMLTIYDDFHKGDHVAVVAQYVHPEEDMSHIQACAWIPGSLDSEMHRKSPRIALLLSDGRIAVVNIVESKVTCVVETGVVHRSPSLLAPATWDHCDGRERVVLFDAAVGDVYFVDIGSETGVLRVNDSASDVAVCPRGDAVLVAQGSRILRVGLDGHESSREELQTVSISTAIRGILAVDEDRYILRLQGSFQLWDIGAGSCLSEWKVGKGDQSALPCSSNHEFGVVGTDDGDAHIFSLEDGKEISVVSVVRVHSGVEAVAISKNGAHIVLAAGNGFLFRYLYC